jgi:hypothetical protein
MTRCKLLNQIPRHTGKHIRYYSIDIVNYYFGSSHRTQEFDDELPWNSSHSRLLRPMVSLRPGKETDRRCMGKGQSMLTNSTRYVIIRRRWRERSSAGLSSPARAADARDTGGEARGCGPRYRLCHSQPDYLFNVRAANMSAFPDDPDHFWRWLCVNTDDKRHLNVAKSSNAEGPS